MRTEALFGTLPLHNYRYGIVDAVYSIGCVVRAVAWCGAKIYHEANKDAAIAITNAQLIKTIHFTGNVDFGGGGGMLAILE